jgi:hypothetical protein
LRGPFVNLASLRCSGQAKNEPRAEILNGVKDILSFSACSAAPAIVELQDFRI